MTATLARARARTTRQEWRRHVLALVLFVVLVWYTVISPSYTAAPLRVRDDAGPDAEEREAETRAGVGFAPPRLARGVAPPLDEFEFGGAEEELDWPEIVSDD